MAQVRQRLDDEDKSLFLNAFATANPLSLLNRHVWDAHGWRKSGKGLMMRTGFRILETGFCPHKYHKWRNAF